MTAVEYVCSYAACNSVAVERDADGRRVCGDPHDDDRRRPALAASPVQQPDPVLDDTASARAALDKAERLAHEMVAAVKVARSYLVET